MGCCCCCCCEYLAASIDRLAGVEVPDALMDGCRLRLVPEAAAARSTDACDMVPIGMLPLTPDASVEEEGVGMLRALSEELLR